MSELTPEEREVASKIWHSLMVTNQIKGEEWESVSEKVQKAVTTAMAARYEVAMLLRKPVDTACPFD